MDLKKTFNEMSVLFPILTLYTLVYLGLMVYDFAAKAAFEMPDGLMAVYIALTGAYAADKEIRRWMGNEAESKNGSIFVYLWLIFFLVAFVIQSLVPAFTLPKNLSAVALQVLGIFFGSKASKKIYETKDAKNLVLTHKDSTLELIKSRGQVTRVEVESAFKISRSSAGRLLDSLETSGIIKQVGDYKDTYYVLADKAAQK